MTRRLSVDYQEVSEGSFLADNQDVPLFAKINVGGSRYCRIIMVQPLRIEVVGESTVHRPAERAVVSITVQSEGVSQEEVSRNVSSTTSQLKEMLERLAPKDASGEYILVAKPSLSRLIDIRTNYR